MKHKLSRRKLLRGMMSGCAVGVGLPLLDCFLNENGNAYAGTLGPLPVRFGTWYWGCGVNSQRWIPRQEGANYECGPELQAIQPFKDKVSVFSNFKCFTDGRTNHAHHTGKASIRTGTAPVRSDAYEAPSIDVLISNAIGSQSRFRSLDISATGNPKHSYSVAAGNVVNPAEVSPLALYKRIFGAEFQDPNAKEFKPDPMIMVRKSVLSAVKDERDDLLKRVGAADRVRLDQYFTSVRQLEQQMALQLQKPPEAKACSIPVAPEELPKGSDIETVIKNHRLMSELLAMAMACNQTRAFNVVFSDHFSTLRKPGISSVHHTLTHEESVDATLGYQPQATWFVEQTMQAWGTFLGILSSIPEGDGSLLDNTLVLAHSEVETARIHSIGGIPMMIAGTAGGRLRSGLHVDGKGTSVTRVGLTAQQIMGIPLDRWGTGSMETARAITDIIA